MDDLDELEAQKALDDLEAQKARILEEIRKRNRANKKAQQDEEDRALIAAAEGPRKAKEKAKKDAPWFEAERKKRPRSPANVDGLENDANHQKKMATTEKDESQPPKKKKKGHGTRSKVKENPKEGRVGRSKKKNTKISNVPEVQVDNDSTEMSDLDDSDLDGDGSDEESEGGIDHDSDEFDRAKLTEKDAKRVLNDELPKGVSNLFDDDLDVEVASTRSRYSVSSGVSRPATSESEGFLDRYQLEDEDGDEDHDDDKPNASTMVKKKLSNRKSKRDDALKSELPTTKAGSRTMSGKSSKSRTQPEILVQVDDDADIPEEKWPKVTRLIVGGLSQQSNVIREVCRDAIRIIEVTLVTKHAWPELHKGTIYKRMVLLEAIDALRANNKDDDDKTRDAEYKVLRTRISKDEKFIRTIGKWVIDRLSHHRGQIRHTAADCIALFQLGVGDECAKRVRALIENDVYVYPGQWANDREGNPIWLTKSSASEVQIYLNPGLIDTIRMAFFNGPTAFGYKYMEHYVSSHPDRKEPELTMSIVALGATAFFAVLWEWREGKKMKLNSDGQKNKGEKFEGDNFKKVYDRHMDTLGSLKKKINTYHQVMSTIYSKVTKGEGEKNTGIYIKGNALAVLDLDGLD